MVPLSHDERTAKYQRLKDLGICGRCENAPAVEGRTRCLDCAEADRRWARARLEESDRDGFCFSCGGARTGGAGNRCRECYDKLLSYRSKRYYQQKRDNICPHCGEKAQPKQVLCARCAARSREYKRTMPSTENDKAYARRLRDERRALGLCTSCGKTEAREGGSLCEGCAEKMRVYAKERRCRLAAARQCPVCGDDVDTPTVWCASCRARRNARKRGRKDRPTDPPR